MCDSFCSAESKASLQCAREAKLVTLCPQVKPSAVRNRKLHQNVLRRISKAMSSSEAFSCTKFFIAPCAEGGGLAIPCHEEGLPIIFHEAFFFVLAFHYEIRLLSVVPARMRLLDTHCLSSRKRSLESPGTRPELSFNMKSYYCPSHKLECVCKNCTESLQKKTKR